MVWVSQSSTLTKYYLRIKDQMKPLGLGIPIIQCNYLKIKDQMEPHGLDIPIIHSN